MKGRLIMVSAANIRNFVLPNGNFPYAIMAKVAEVNTKRAKSNEMITTASFLLFAKSVLITSFGLKGVLADAVGIGSVISDGVTGKLGSTPATGCVFSTGELLEVSSIHLVWISPEIKVKWEGLALICL